MVLEAAYNRTYSGKFAWFEAFPIQHGDQFAAALKGRKKFVQRIDSAQADTSFVVVHFTRVLHEPFALTLIVSANNGEITPGRVAPAPCQAKAMTATCPQLRK